MSGRPATRSTGRSRSAATSCSPGGNPGRHAACPWMRRIIAAGANSRRWSQISIAAGSSRCSMVAAAGRGTLPSLAARTATTGDSRRVDRPVRGLPAGDPERAAVGADRRRSPPPDPRRQQRAGQRPPRQPARAGDPPAKGHPPLRSPRPAEPPGLPGPPPGCSRPKSALRWVYYASDRAQAEQRLERFLTAVEHAHLHAFDALERHPSSASDFVIEVGPFFKT